MNADRLQALEWEDETAFGEDAATFAGGRMPVVGVVDISGVTHAKIPGGHVIQRLQEGSPHFLGAQGGSIKFRLWARGHGVTTAGTPTVDAVEGFMGKHVFGSVALSGATLSAADSTTLTGGTAAVPLTTASQTFTAGSLVRVGTLGDGRGNGQMYPVGSHALLVLTLLAELEAAPNAADVLYPCVNYAFPESATSDACTITGVRFRFLSTNQRYEFHGCYLIGAVFGGTNTGDAPYWDIEMGVSWFRTIATGTFPSVVASLQYNPAPITNGSFFIANVGTATRAGAKRNIRDFSISVKAGVVPLRGPGGAGPYQAIVGAKRIPTDIEWSWLEDADSAATATPVIPGFYSSSSSTRKHAMWTGSVTPGSAIGAYAPALCFIDPMPMQMGSDGINRFRIKAKAYTGATVTSDLTCSATRWGNG